MAKPPLLFVFREMSEDVWDSCLIAETRRQAYLDGGWHVLISEQEVRQQMIEDEYAAALHPFNGLRERL